MTLFDEPAGNQKGVRVLHPQVDASVKFADSVSVAAGYNADIVTGATPRTFGPTRGLDAVSKATPFSDTRHLFHGGIGLERPDNGISASYAYGFESDYKTHSLSATTYTDLYEHNFRLGLAYTHNWDSVCDANNAAAAGNLLNLVTLTSSQNCFTTRPRRRHPPPDHRQLRAVALLDHDAASGRPGGTTIQILDGFQSNPYRAVQFGNQRHAPQERQPRFASATPCSSARPTRSPSCGPRRGRWCASTTTAGRCAP